MNKKIIWIIIFVLILGGVWWANSRPTVIPTDEPIKIGVILPLTGDVAVVGEEVQKGVMIAEKELLTQGLNLKVVYEDDAYTSRLAVTAASKLLEIDKVEAAMTLLVEGAKPIIPLFNEKNVPLLVLWDSNVFINTAGPTIYSVGFSTEKAGETMAVYAYNNLGLKRVALFGHIDAWADIITPAFKNKFESLGGQIVSQDKITADTVDYRTHIAKLKQLNPDGVYFPLVPPQSARFLIQASQLGLKTTLLTGDALIQDMIVEAGQAAEGIYFTNIYSDEVEILTQKYRQTFNADPVDTTLVAFGYDGLMKLVEAKKNSADLLPGLSKVFNGKQSLDKLEKIFQVVNGQPVEVGTKI
ncbi:MAG: penicillin-binding protein activator [Candidatus Vogelbacteria bacterium]|nr:penicillin-binding protein activator [Candidatus Vogelbacteria bacterium]